MHFTGPLWRVVLLDGDNQEVLDMPAQKHEVTMPLQHALGVQDCIVQEDDGRVLQVMFVCTFSCSLKDFSENNRRNCRKFRVRFGGQRFTAGCFSVSLLQYTLLSPRRRQMTVPGAAQLGGGLR